jgi:hypothetical protein
VSDCLKLRFELLSQVDVEWAQARVEDVARFVSCWPRPLGLAIVALPRTQPAGGGHPLPHQRPRVTGAARASRTAHLRHVLAPEDRVAQPGDPAASEDNARLRAQLERSLGEQRVMKPTKRPMATISTVGDMSLPQTS